MVVADMASPDDCARLLEESRDALGGRIDMLLLNAGISMSCPFSALQDVSFFRYVPVCVCVCLSRAFFSACFCGGACSS